MIMARKENSSSGNNGNLMTDYWGSSANIGTWMSEGGVAGTDVAETGIIDDLTNNDNDGGGGGGGTYIYYGGGGGGYSSSKSPEDVQKETQNQIWNTQANYFKRRGDMDKLSKDSLGNIEKQMKANDALLRQQNAQNQRSIQWQPNQQREQSTLMALRNRMGNAAYGSSLVDLREGMGRVDDMNDNALIESWRQNADNAYSNWFQANAQLVSDYNDQAMSDEDEYSKLYSQYWSAMSNLNPMLATCHRKNCCNKHIPARAFFVEHPADERNQNYINGCKKGIFAGSRKIAAYCLSCVCSKKKYAGEQAVANITGIQLPPLFYKN